MKYRVCDSHSSRWWHAAPWLVRWSQQGEASGLRPGAAGLSEIWLSCITHQKEHTLSARHTLRQLYFVLTFYFSFLYGITISTCYKKRLFFLVSNGASKWVISDAKYWGRIKLVVEMY